jgi:hypothetical protein
MAVAAVPLVMSVPASPVAASPDGMEYFFMALKLGWGRR